MNDPKPILYSYAYAESIAYHLVWAKTIPGYIVYICGTFGDDKIKP